MRIYTRNDTTPFLNSSYSLFYEQKGVYYVPPIVTATKPVTSVVVKANTTNTTAASNSTNATIAPAWNDTQVGEKFYLEVLSSNRLRLLFTSKANLSLAGTVRNLKSVDIVTLVNQSVVAGNQTIVLPNMRKKTYTLLAYSKGLLVLPVNQSFLSLVQDPLSLLYANVTTIYAALNFTQLCEPTEAYIPETGTCTPCSIQYGTVTSQDTQC